MNENTAASRDGTISGRVDKLTAEGAWISGPEGQQFLPFDELIFDPIPSPATIKAPHRKTTTKTRDNWRTPKRIFDYWHSRFNFDLDAAADVNNALCQNFFTEQNSALKADWPHDSTVWCNPPYSISWAFALAALRHRFTCKNIVLLVPSATDTMYWRSVAREADEIWISAGRIGFVDPDSGETKNGNPIGSTIFVLSPRAGATRDGSKRIGFFCNKSGRPIEGFDQPLDL